MGKFRPTKNKNEFNLMTALDKRMVVLKDEPNGFQDKVITVLDGYVNNDNEVIIKSVCGKEINSKFLKYAEKDKKRT